MKTEKFEKKIKHLSQIEILSGAINALNQLLIDRGFVSEGELQDYFKKWMRQHGRPMPLDMTLEEMEELEAKHSAFIGHGPRNILTPKKKRVKK